MATDNARAFTMKLHIDTAARRVAFAETTKDLVDYLISLLEEHVSFLGLEEMVREGCVDNLFDSAEELAAAAAAAEHRPCACGSCHLRPAVQQPPKKRFFQCSYNRGPTCGEFVTETSGAVCPSCGFPMATEVSYGTPGAGCSGSTAAFAGAGGSTAPCVLTDDLRAKSMSRNRIGTLTMMRILLLGDAQNVWEKTVQLGHDEVIISLFRNSNTLPTAQDSSCS